MSEPTYTPTEMMTVTAARALGNGDICFVGIGLPSAACNLARLTHAPRLTLVYEPGTLETKPDVLPLSIGDGELCETALTTVSVPEMFQYWLQGGRISLGFQGPALIVTDLCTMRPDPETKEFEVVSLHPGVTRERVRENTGWEIRFSSRVDETRPPDPHELETLRALNDRTARAHGTIASD
jgi:acyl CoA:acetate/3-ketoacid CoA transferase beta subunit